MTTSPSAGPAGPGPTAVAPLHLDERTFLLVLTGAGISAESGVPTFRDSGGLWHGHAVEDVASPEGFARDPLLVWRFYSERRAGVAGVSPNPAHRALVAVEARLGDRFLLVTQNVDGLHHAAGSQRVIEMHGALRRSRCTGCDRPAFDDPTAYRPGVAPLCGRCRAAGRDALLRPDIVWFGEAIPPGVFQQLEAFFAAARAPAAALRFVAVGTSGLVEPAASIVDLVRRRGGRSWLVNADRSANASSFDEVVIGKAGVALPALLGC